jgi:ferritin-like protein
VVRVRCDDPADNTDKDDDGAIQRRHNEVREEFERVKELQRQMDERMKTLEDNAATHQQNMNEKLSDIERMLREVFAAKAS